MCEEHSLDDMAKQQRADNLSRRGLGKLGIGATLFAALPRAADAMDVVEQEVTIQTPDGTADAHFVHPAGGKYPAVLVWPDAFGLRPAFKQMGKRLAEAGYAVLTPNPYYRSGKSPVMPEGLDFSKPDDRAQIMKFMSSLSPQTHVTDAAAFIAFIDSQGAVDSKRKMGTTGYCMGGPITMRTAALRPDRVGAGASFHGGGLVTDKPESPHLLVPKMKAQYLFAIAENDDKQQPTAKDDLRKAFDAASLKAEIEVYAGTQHGWCPPDAAVYNQVAAEKAWSRLNALFKTALV